VGVLFDYDSQANLIATDQVKNHGLEFHHHPNPYLLVFVNKCVDIKVTKLCKIKFVISAEYIDSKWM